MPHRPRLRVLVIHSDRPVRERVGRLFLYHPRLEIHHDIHVTTQINAISWALMVLPAQKAVEYAVGAVPVIAYGHEARIGACFTSGCADFMREPWTPEELEARALRVLGEGSQRIGPCVLAGKDLSGPRAVVRLSRVEARLLGLLSGRIGHVLHRQAIMAVLEGRAGKNSRQVDVYVSRLRAQLSRVTGNGSVQITCTRGRGYALEIEQQSSQ